MKQISVHDLYKKMQLQEDFLIMYEQIFFKLQERRISIGYFWLETVNKWLIVNMTMYCESQAMWYLRS